jgi:hypothetical protein
VGRIAAPILYVDKGKYLPLSSIRLIVIGEVVADGLTVTPTDLGYAQ